MSNIGNKEAFSKNLARFIKNQTRVRNRYVGF